MLADAIDEKSECVVFIQQGPTHKFAVITNMLSALKRRAMSSVNLATTSFSARRHFTDLAIFVAEPTDEPGRSAALYLARTAENCSRQVLEASSSARMAFAIDPILPLCLSSISAASSRALSRDRSSSVSSRCSFDDPRDSSSATMISLARRQIAMISPTEPNVMVDMATEVARNVHR